MNKPLQNKAGSKSQSLMLTISLCHHIPHSKHICILLFVESTEGTDGATCAGDGEGDEEEIRRAEGGNTKKLSNDTSASSINLLTTRRI